MGSCSIYVHYKRGGKNGGNCTWLPKCSPRGQFWWLFMVPPQDDFWQQGTNFVCQTLPYGDWFWMPKLDLGPLLEPRMAAKSGKNGPREVKFELHDRATSLMSNNFQILKWAKILLMQTLCWLLGFLTCHMFHVSVTLYSWL